MSRGHSLMDWNRLAMSADVAHGKYSNSRIITAEELRQHLDWCCLKGKVYDISSYAPYHPGGTDELFRGGGGDGTLLFNEFHPWIQGDAMLRRCQVGVLEESSAPMFVTVSSVQSLGPSGYCWITLTFETDPGKDMGFPDSILSHVKLQTTNRENRNIERPYTQLLPPLCEEKSLHLLVKISKRNPKAMTLALSQIGTRFSVSFHPSLVNEESISNATELGVVCAGTGITPALQLLCRNPLKKRIRIVWCHRTEEDCVLLPGLDQLMDVKEDLLHLLSRQESPSSGSLDRVEFGRFDSDLLDKQPHALPKPDPGNVILICGPWEFERSVRASLFMAGFSSSSLVRIPG